MLKSAKFLACFISLLLAFFSVNEAFAQSRGGVQGVLKDAYSGEVLMYANVVLEGTTMGTVTDNEGSLFLDMYRYTGNEEYKAAFITLCNSLVDLQGPEGLWMDFMPNDKESGSVHPRFNLWYAESLIDGYELTGDKRYLAAYHDYTFGDKVK